MEWLNELNRGGTNLPGHSDRNKVPGIDATTGSLGQGLSIACGLAHSIQISKSNQYVYCITGDGENDEGQIWEAAMYASHYKLDHLIMFLDWNKRQIDGENARVMNLGDLTDKYKAFGWQCQLINGSDISAIYYAILKAKEGREKPAVIILDTVKGAGVPCIEAIDNNHCIRMPKALAEQSCKELDEIRNMICEENN